MFTNYNVEIKECRGDPLYALKATSDPDTMYMHEAQHERDMEITVSDQNYRQFD